MTKRIFRIIFLTIIASLFLIGGGLLLSPKSSCACMSYKEEYISATDSSEAYSLTTKAYVAGTFHKHMIINTNYYSDTFKKELFFNVKINNQPVKIQIKNNHDRHSQNKHYFLDIPLDRGATYDLTIVQDNQNEKMQHSFQFTTEKGLFPKHSVEHVNRNN